jgi:hypothetical protein
VIDNHTLIHRSGLAPANALLAQVGFFERCLGVVFPPEPRLGFVGPDSLGYHYRINRTGTEPRPRVSTPAAVTL